MRAGEDKSYCCDPTNRREINNTALCANSVMKKLRVMAKTMVDPARGKSDTIALGSRRTALSRHFSSHSERANPSPSSKPG